MIMTDLHADTLKIRGRLVASHQIPVLSTNPEQFGVQLMSAIRKAPALFLNAPVVLDVSSQGQLKATDLQAIVKICRARHLVPYALTSEHSIHKPLSNRLGLAWLDFKKRQVKRSLVQAPDQTKVISTPVRSGQQVYAKDANLVIMNLVSTGAEVIADGYIHIFGPLRGKAIAGASGYTSADIICQKMSAELVSIAGTYLVQEQHFDSERGARCSLNNDSIHVEYL